MTARHRRAPTKRPAGASAAAAVLGLVVAAALTRAVTGTPTSTPRADASMVADRAYARGPSPPGNAARYSQVPAGEAPAATRTQSAVTRVPLAPHGLARPVRVQIPAIGVDSRLQALHRLPDGMLQTPNRWQRPGYYADGILPGQIGPAVIVGHVDSVAGPAVFYRLRSLRQNDRILVTLANGRRLRFMVDREAAYPKSGFPSDVLYGPTPLPELRLVTCTGAFDWSQRSYLDNLIVFAHLA